MNIIYTKPQSPKFRSKLLKLAFTLLVIFVSLPSKSFSQNGQWLNYSSGTWSRDIIFIGNNAWVATSGGIVKLDTLNGDFIVYDKQNLPIPSNNFYSAAYDSVKNEFWFGLFQAGALKFDGTNWTYFNNLYDVRDITIDKNNVKWFATTMGVSKYNDTTWTNYTQWDSGLASSSTFSITIDKNNNKWIGTYAGISKYNDTTWTTFNTGNSTLSDNYINQIAIDAQNRKWVATFNGGLCMFNDTTFTTYNGLNTAGAITNYTTTIAIDKNDVKWVGCLTGGIASFNNDNWQKYDKNNAFPYLDQTSTIVIDNNQNKWVGSIGYGLFKFNGSSWIRYNTSKSGLSTQELFTVFIDSKQNKWFGGYQGGAAKFDGENWTSYNDVNSPLPHNSVQRYAEDSLGNIWIVTNGGIMKFDGTTWTTIPQTSGTPRYIAIDKFNKKLVGTNAGLEIYNDTVWTIYNTFNTPQLPSDYVSYIKIDKDNVKWIGTNNGLVKYNDTTFTVFNQGNSLLPDNNIGAIAIDSNNVKWIGTELGLTTFNDINWTLEKSNISVHDITIDKKDNKWISTSTGLLHYDNTEWLNYTSNNSLLQYNWIWDTEFDADSNLWIAQNGGGVSMIVVDSTKSDIFPEFNYTIDTVTNTVNFVNTSKGTILNYYWNFGDNSFSNLEAPTHKYQIANTFNVCLTAKNNLREKMFCQDVIISNNPCRSFFRYDSTSNPNAFEFNAIPYDTTTTFYWSFGDGYTSTEKTLTHLYANQGSYNVKLITTNEYGCVSQYEEVVKIGGDTLNECVADFIYTIDLNTNTVSFIDKSETGGTPSLLWDLGNGQTEVLDEFNMVYPNDGYYNVCLNISDSVHHCVDMICKTIKINNDTNFIKASFIAQINPDALEVGLTNTSSGNYNKVYWDFGDDSTSSIDNPLHVYADTGYYLIHLRVSNSTNDKYDDHIEFIDLGTGNNSLAATFGYTSDSTFNAKSGGYPVQFNGSSYGDASEVAWNFGDGTQNSSSMSPLHYFDNTGVYYVCLTVSNNNLGTSDEFCAYITLGATSIKENTSIADEFNMYPNPAKDLLFIDNNQTTIDSKLTIINTFGQIVYSKEINENNSTINIKNLEEGLYFVKFGNTVKKLIINN